MPQKQAGKGAERKATAECKWASQKQLMTQEEDNFAPSWDIRSGFQTLNWSTPDPQGEGSTEHQSKED